MDDEKDTSIAFCVCVCVMNFTIFNFLDYFAIKLIKTKETQTIE